VSDRHHLSASRQPLQRLTDGVRRLAADPRVDLVEDDRLAAADRGDRQRDAGKLAARGRVGNGCERQACVRADLEGDRVRSGQPKAVRLLRQLDAKLALAHADSLELGRDGRRERLGSGLPRLPHGESQLFDPPLRDLDRLGRGRDGIGPVIQRIELGLRLGGPPKQLLVRRAAKTPLRLGNPVELGLDLLEPIRLGVERGEKAAELGRGLA